MISGMPRYLTVAEDLKAKIRAGVYPAGAFLPSEKELEEFYGVSRSTIRAAIAKLRDLGMVRIVRGKGTKVTRLHILQSLENPLSFTEVIRAQGMEPGTMVREIRAVKANAEVASKLGIDTGEEVLEVGRLRTADEEVVGYVVSYLRKDHPVDKDRLETVMSLYKYLNDTYGVSVLFTEDIIYAEPASATIAGLLRVREGVPVLVLERIAYAEDQQPIEFVYSFVRSDRLKYRVRSYRRGKLE